MIKLESPLAYGIRTKSKDILQKSSSGGIFSEIANYFIDNGGVVYGCILNEKVQAVYLRGTEKKDIERMRGSKYVRSEIKGVKERVQGDLLKKLQVLFVGPPCYIAHITKDLTKEEMKFLTTVDFICHGTPHPKSFSDHIKYLENFYNEKAINYSFRDKRYGWGHDEYITFESGKRKDSIKEVGRFKRLFYSDYVLSADCFKCKYTKINRNSDLTIGDFWGVEEILNIYDNKGVSALLITTKKGVNLFEIIRKNLLVYDVKVTDFHHGPLKHPTPMPKEYQDFWKEYRKYGYKFVTDKYVAVSKKEMFSAYRRRIVHLLKLDKLAFSLKYKLKELKNNGK